MTAMEPGQRGEGQSSRPVGTDGPCSCPRSTLMRGVPSSCTSLGGTGKGLRGTGSQFTLLGQQRKSLSRNVAGGQGGSCYGKKESGWFFMTVADGWGCVNTQPWHPGRVTSPYPMLGECPGDRHAELSSPKPVWGRWSGGAASFLPAVRAGDCWGCPSGLSPQVWPCHPPRGCAWCCACSGGAW